MLGCQDFCGYYDWTFHHVAQRFGQSALHALWEEAIGGESQAHYEKAGAALGLRGLYTTWTRTGEDEHCDWTFTLDEQRNVLRWDMRECPSKGFLLQNDLNASEDYCDHCVGWIAPLLARVGVEVAAHEHNHCGQCWGELRMKDRPYESLALPIDIRKDPRWDRGFLDRWAGGTQLPVLDERGGSVDPCAVLTEWARRASEIVILTGDSYARGDACPDAAIVLLSAFEGELPLLAQRFSAAAPSERPLLVHPFFPGLPAVPFARYALPRPVPILPLLIRSGLYLHAPGQGVPSDADLVRLLAQALKPASTM